MKVVIVGAGFGGLKLARKLNNKKGFDILLIDRFNYHQFQPLFYQVATGGLDASNISFPLRKVFQKSKNVRIRLATLQQILPSENKIITDTGEIDYDVLVLSMGADTNFFNNSNISDNSFPMKSTVEALQIRHRLIQNFEDALTVTDKDELQRLMNIVVVGGGPTGVELSGTLAEMKTYVLPKDYPELDFSKMNIYLLEGTDRTLGTMSLKSSRQSKRYLEKLGVQVMTQNIVKDYDGQDVLLQDGKRLHASTVIWAAGIKGNIPDGIDKSLIARGNRLLTDRQCRLLTYNNIYSIGDLASMKTPKYPNGHPQVAPVAIQQAKFLAKKLRRGEEDSPLPEFEYKDKGSMATVGRNLAVVDVPRPKIHFRGFVAWMIWMGLHLMLILGVKNRFFVFSNWLYNYTTYDQNLRLIFKEFYKPRKKKL
ncbi:MAG: NAD(P)/FAD-dependent oxidoreductase [Bacteroidetes bacterium]|nr:NAD(P)/FAD-dependent oxidoreductase [Bacteroidota bacterium]MBS1633243.1 NAD(P)/FAD-dependent oxidoreductase [Bacteroidota bacterium]